MSDELGSAAEIRKLTNKLLNKADAYGVFPTPVEQVIEAAGLIESDEDLFDDSFIARLPTLLRKQIDKLKYKVRAALDRREKIIFLNKENGNQGSLAFRRLHEISHEIFPWQQDLAFADDSLTLAPHTKKLFELEANFGASELLFQNDQFGLLSRDYPVSIASVIELKEKFGSSIHAAFRRFTETYPLPVVGLVIEPSVNKGAAPVFRRNEITMSSDWARQFGSYRRFPPTMSLSNHAFLEYAAAAELSPNKVVEGIAELVDKNGLRKEVKVEAFYNTYKILLMMWLPGKRKALRAKRVLIAS